MNGVGREQIERRHPSEHPHARRARGAAARREPIKQQHDPAHDEQINRAQRFDAPPECGADERERPHEAGQVRVEHVPVVRATFEEVAGRHVVQR